jgi:hypothetical protein
MSRYEREVLAGSIAVYSVKGDPAQASQLRKVA